VRESADGKVADCCDDEEEDFESIVCGGCEEGSDASVIPI
jgi:hypothetical protein